VKALTVPYKAHLALGTTTLATCWKATLQDGTIIRATSHDRDITYNSELYPAASSYTKSDVVSASDMSPDNLELEGFLASPGITEEDVLSGRWDYAAIEIFEVNYTDTSPAMGRNVLRKGTLGEVSASRSKFRAELRGIMQAFSRRIVKVTTKECLADLGDSRCGVDLAPFTVTGTVDVVTNYRQFTDAARTEAADWFTGGVITWTSGENNGLRMEVRRSTATGVIELHENMPFAITVGDTYSLHAGCSKRFEEDCIGKFSNGVNFRGFPHLPLSDVYKRGGTN
jgi:uncharacterized phage protein (TIGR02218 family)